MPELPEVQTVVNYLNKKISGQKIININVFAEKMIKNVSVIDFKNHLKGSTIEKVERLGKYLIFSLNSGYTMVSHLRMEGKYLIKSLDKTIGDKHIHLIFELENMNLYYHDTRKFGTFTLYKNTELSSSLELVKIAIDPLNNLFDAKYLYTKISKSKKAIKTILLDQSIVSGIGNIYACEILFSAKVSPFKLGGEITINECKLIVIESKRILNLAIENKGTTVSTFSFDDNHLGMFQNYLNVYNKKDQPCNKCNTIITKTPINKRGTYYCHNCQK